LLVKVIENTNKKIKMFRHFFYLAELKRKFISVNLLKHYIINKQTTTHLATSDTE